MNKLTAAAVACLSVALAAPAMADEPVSRGLGGRVVSKTAQAAQEGSNFGQELKTVREEEPDFRLGPAVKLINSFGNQTPNN